MSGNGAIRGGGSVLPTGRGPTIGNSQSYHGRKAPVALEHMAPDELAKYLLDNRLVITEQTGVVYNPFADKWGLSSDTDVNYMVIAEEMV